MPSILAWIDHDSAARERTLRILSLFQEKESRDELGLSSLRDSFADQLFMVASQTRMTRRSGDFGRRSGGPFRRLSSLGTRCLLLTFKRTPTKRGEIFVDAPRVRPES